MTGATTPAAASSPALDAAPVVTPRPVLLMVVNVGWFFLSHRLIQAKAAQAAGYTVHVACGVETPTEEHDIRALGFVLHVLPLRRSSASPMQTMRLVSRLTAVMRSVRPDVVHLVALKPILLGGLVARWLRIPRVVAAFSGLGFVFTGSGPRARISRTIVLLLFRAALGGPRCRAIFQNDDDRGVFERAGILRPEQVTMVRGVGVDLQRFRPAIEVPPPVVVLFPARILRDKGVVEFARAAGLVRERGRAARYLLAGAPDDENPTALSVDEIRDLERRFGVEWLGHVDDMAQKLDTVHVVCLPSYREGLPKALVEAAAAGKPLVATDVPGCRDVVEHDVNGLLVPARDERALADALQRLIDDPQLRRRLGDASRRIAEQRFSDQVLAGQVLDAYRTG